MINNNYIVHVKYAPTNIIIDPHKGVCRIFHRGGGGFDDVATIAGYSPLYWPGGSRSLHLIKNEGEQGGGGSGPPGHPPPRTRAYPFKF